MNGTLDQFKDAVLDRIHELSGVDNIESASTIDDSQNYLEKLAGQLKHALMQAGYMYIRIDNDVATLYVTLLDTMVEYQIPFSDLSFSTYEINDDVDYICSEIFKE